MLGLKVVQNVQLMNRIIMNFVTQCVWQSVKIVTFYIDCSEEPTMDGNIEIFLLIVSLEKQILREY